MPADATKLHEVIDAGWAAARHRPWPRAIVSHDGWLRATNALANGELTLLGLWADGEQVHMALAADGRDDFGVISIQCEGKRYPSVGQMHPPALRLERAIRDLWGLDAEGLPDARPWLDHGTWNRATPGRATRCADAPPSLRLPSRNRGKPPSDPGRPGPCGDYRAWSFPVHGERRSGRPARGAPRIRAQGNRAADDGNAHRSGSSPRGARFR